MTTISNITQLRDHALDTLEKLDAGAIDVVQAGVTGKLYEAVISSLKTQIIYAEIREVQPNIAFLEEGMEIIAIEDKQSRHAELVDHNPGGFLPRR